jgi:microcin C transport system permease protein
VVTGHDGRSGGATHARTGVSATSNDSHYRGGRGLDPEVIAEITKRYGFDKPIHERYFKMLWDYVRFDFGNSLFRSASVLQLIKESLPVSVTLGLWGTLIIYLVSIPLGSAKRSITAAGSTSGAALLLLSATRSPHFCSLFC